MTDLPALRASDADRDRTVALLRDHAAEGRLTLEEFADRMERAYNARTHDELNELARQNEPECLQAALELAVVQRSELVELMDTGDDLLRRLASQADKLTI